LDGNHYKSTSFLTFTTLFAIPTTSNIRRSISYWIVDGESGDIPFFVVFKPLEI
jgi:hypothetical protein